MEITVSDTTITVVVNNTSPITWPNLPNAPGITGFGFNVDPDSKLESWTLFALDSGGNSLDIGEYGTGHWQLDPDTFTNIEVDYLADTAGENTQGALYNPLANCIGSPLASLPHFFYHSNPGIIFLLRRCHARLFS